MADLVPKLVPRPAARSIKLLGLVLPGVRTVTAQIEPYTAWWDEQNQAAAEGSGPLLVAIGDSTAIGIGASNPDNGYIGLLARQLTERDGTPWRVINLGLSGARLDDALGRQLPILADLAPKLHPDLVTCCIGTNDLVWGRETTKLRTNLRVLVERLPPQSVVGTLAGASARGRLGNRALRNAAAERELPLVDPWSEPGPGSRERLAADGFHPNDLGYELMSRPFARKLDIPLVADEPDSGDGADGDDGERVPRSSDDDR